jgi:hypothetical protein
MMENGMECWKLQSKDIHPGIAVDNIFCALYTMPAPTPPSRVRGASWATVAATTASAALAGAVAVWFSRLVQKYGWSGACRFVWEGNPHPEHLRDYVATLDEAEQALQSNEEAIMGLELALNKCRAEASSTTANDMILAGWKGNLPAAQRDLQMVLAQVSYSLDELAAKLDQPTTEEQLRVRRKTLSQKVVALMGRIDVLIAHYNDLSDNKKGSPAA